MSGMLTWVTTGADQHWLKLHDVEIASVSVRYDPEWPWVVFVQRQRGLDGPVVGGKAKTLRHGKKMAERWARMNLPRLEVEVAERLAKRPRHKGAG